MKKILSILLAMLMLVGVLMAAPVSVGAEYHRAACDYLGLTY